MIKLIRSVLKNLNGVALSGGLDSMAALSFLCNARKNVTAFYFDHSTPHGADARQFIESYCAGRGIPLIIRKLEASKPEELSWEEFWRIERYKFLHSFTDYTIATAHHLDDAAETYLWGCLHGAPRTIHPRQPGPDGKPTNIVRPFLLTPKQDLVDWCHRKKVPYVNDPSNADTKYSRNRIRHNIMPEALKVNPGLLTVVRKHLLASFGELNDDSIPNSGMSAFFPAS